MILTEEGGDTHSSEETTCILYIFRLWIIRQVASLTLCSMFVVVVGLVKRERGVVDI